MKSKNNKKLTDLDITNNLESSYDDVPYQSYPFGHVTPEILRTVANIFNLDSPLVEKARVLELGCAGGGNLMRFSSAYPESYTLGVDLSKVQIDAGKKVIQDLGIKNLELKRMSIMDLDESYGKFDYIICHGVFSWVPEIVQNKILEIGNKLLSDKGVMFISYNALPGWNMQQTVRDLMSYHSNNFQNSQDKINQAKLVIDFVNGAFGDNQSTPYAAFIKEVLDDIIKRRDDYVLHEYLEATNKAFYFHEFMKMASDHGMTYLGESDVASMYIGNMSEPVIEKLSVINDIVRTEQYMDFIRNRKFRCTLLCKNTSVINRSVNKEVLDQLFFSTEMTPDLKEGETITDELITSEIEMKFRIGTNANVTTNGPLIKAFFMTMHKYGSFYLSLSDLVNKANKYFSGDKTSEIKAAVIGPLLQMIFSSQVKVNSTKPKMQLEVSKHPKVSDLVLYQVKNNLLTAPGTNETAITNQLNQLVALTDVQKVIVANMDGKNNINQIKEAVFLAFLNKSLKAEIDGQEIVEENKLRQISDSLVSNFLDQIKNWYLLVA